MTSLPERRPGTWPADFSSSVLNDDMMHVGQATYAHGIVLRARVS
jgi:hypothetical protein